MLLTLFLIGPPLVRLGIHNGWVAAEVEDIDSPGVLIQQQSDLIAMLENRLREVNRDLQLVTSSAGLIYDPSGGPGSRNAARYRIATADVLPLSSPSSSDRALCVSFYGVPPIRRDSTALFEDQLVGRLIDESTGKGAGRIQSILDPAFRVRFRCGEDKGMLWGTGQSDKDGYPLLEVHHLGKPPAFKAGDVVFTEGGDGRYPPGCILGRIFHLPGQEGSRAIVRSGLRLSTLKQVALLEDLAATDLASRGKSDR